MSWINKYKNGGSLPKAQLGRNISESTRIDIPVDKEFLRRVNQMGVVNAINSEIVPENSEYIPKQFATIGPYQDPDKYKKAVELQKKKNYASSKSNVRLNNRGDLETINVDRDFEGRAISPNAKRFDKGLDHIMTGIETAGAIMGVGQIGSNLLRLGASQLEKQIGRNLVSKAAKNFTNKINPALTSLDEAASYAQLDPIGIMGNRLNSQFYNPTTGLNTANNTVTGVNRNLTNSGIEAIDLVAGDNNLRNITVPKPTSAFKSEIDWGKWNPETPKYPELIDEYNAIEESTKKAGTWMKNPDGSAFQGTPEQFIQQQSSWFKKAFGDSKLLNPDGSPMFLYHGSAKKFDTFDPSKFQLGDAGYSGVGIYTTPSKTTANSYATSSAKFHSGDIEPTVYQLYGQGNRPIKSSDLIKENQGRDLFNFYRDKNWKGELSPYESLREYDAAISDQLPNVQNIRPLHDAREIVFPKNTQLKSAVGNVGFFDMTNPNIYKAVVPAAIGTTALGAIEQKRKGGVIKDNRGQWVHPGEITEIEGNTMATYGYGDIPLYVVPDVGKPRVVQPNTGNHVFPGATKFTEYPIKKNGGWLNKYDEGGINPEDPKKTILKNKTIGEIRTPKKKLNLQSKIYPENQYSYKDIFDNSCLDPTGLGCSWQATREAQKITGLPLESYAPANAGYRDAVAKRYGLQNIFDQTGSQKLKAERDKPGWKEPTAEDFSSWKEGDIVVLDSGSSGEKFNYGPPKGFTEKDLTWATHNGVIVGHTPSGVPVIRHGFAKGKGKGRQITEALDKKNRLRPLGHGEYAVKSVWRPREINENNTVDFVRPIVDTGEDRAKRKEDTYFPASFSLNSTHEEKLMNELPVAAAFSGADTRLGVKESLVNWFNDPKLDKELQYKFGIDSKTLQNLKPVLYGIAGQESNFHDVNSLLAAGKDIGGDALNLTNSKGLFQINFESLTEDEREALDIKSPNDLLDDKKAYQAAVVMMHNAKKRMDSEIEQGTHPELVNADPYFRAAYYYNSPGRAVSTAEEWGKGNDPTTWYNPNTWLNPLVSRERTRNFSVLPNVGDKLFSLLNSQNPNYRNKAELRLDKGSYPYKLMQKAADLRMNIDLNEPEIMEEIIIRAPKKGSTIEMYDKKQNGGWINKYK